MTPIDLYGIPNCDTVRKARAWLDARGRSYTFHDFRKEGVDAARLARWIQAAGLDMVVNRRGTTWRALSGSDRALIEAGEAVTVLQANPAMIRRPVVEHPDGLLIGFREDEWFAALS